MTRPRDRRFEDPEIEENELISSDEGRMEIRGGKLDGRVDPTALNKISEEVEELRESEGREKFANIVKGIRNDNIADPMLRGDRATEETKAYSVTVEESRPEVSGEPIGENNIRQGSSREENMEMIDSKKAEQVERYDDPGQVLRDSGMTTFGGDLSANAGRDITTEDAYVAVYLNEKKKKEEEEKRILEESERLQREQQQQALMDNDIEIDEDFFAEDKKDDDISSPKEKDDQNDFWNS